MKNEHTKLHLLGTLPFAAALTLGLAVGGCDRGVNDVEADEPLTADDPGLDEGLGLMDDETVGGGGAIADDNPFGTDDTDRDGRLTQAEWRESDLGQRWDANDDSYVDDTELAGALSTQWDTNQNQRIEQNEFDAGRQRWWGDDNELSFDTWDRNQDDALDRTEIERGLGGMDYESAWDRNDDGRVAWSDVNENVYRGWDTDNDGFIETTEYRAD